MCLSDNERVFTLDVIGVYHIKCKLLQIMHVANIYVTNHKCYILIRNQITPYRKINENSNFSICKMGSFIKTFFQRHFSEIARENNVSFGRFP